MVNDSSDFAGAGEHERGEKHAIRRAVRNGPAKPASKGNHVVSGGLCGATVGGFAEARGEGDDVRVHEFLPGGWAGSGDLAFVRCVRGRFPVGCLGGQAALPRLASCADKEIFVRESGAMGAEMGQHLAETSGI